ncbi:S-adenosyl-L-methionine-dependent methyltransferase [Tilletiaria anomala UBC 951]|uniref:S-adenosyl-L-methionine-dependent methyltransferase n=1 Tax=Tilletiaria anomala (strain ATCC 24038 / CBS 436.72 / UBC 951) TaxID=1037660 RepID=A0A066W7V9_TILAU|nr:S-adenosyl-L-methionine-dependent methyltransferase [Tilletiaria anomala UBC 951]KDN47174.1 S-adenosyl-L-methionine-dependent methyltransferase [Tilletiaria anomala UBC 951]
MLHLFGGPIGAPEALKVLEQGGKVLDVGCGPGSWIKQVANLYPKCKAFATDFAPTYSPVQVGDAAKVEFQVGDVLKSLPYNDGSFDFVQMRFFTGALKAHEWVPAVKEVYRVVKPGGWVQLIEPDGELRCRNGESADITDWNTRGMRGSLLKRGGDPLAGTRLDKFMAEAGFDSSTIRVDIASVPVDAKAGPLGALMEHDYLALVQTLAPILGPSWGITADEMVNWGKRIVHKCSEHQAFHNFVCAVARKSEKQST